MDSFTYLNGEFINLYTKENPILEFGNECYCMIFNNTDYHRPIIIKGTIIQDKFSDGMNKQYFVKVLDILESPKTIKEFIIGKSFDVIPYHGETLHAKKTVQITNVFNYNNYLFKVESFFIRNEEQKIRDLRTEYINIIKDDINKMLKDIENITNI